MTKWQSNWQGKGKNVFHNKHSYSILGKPQSISVRLRADMRRNHGKVVTGRDEGRNVFHKIQAIVF